MWPALKPSQRVALAGAIAPQNAAVGTLSTGWVDVSRFANLMAVIQTGAFGAGATVDANIQQAQDNVGTGAKAFGTALAITEETSAAANTQAVINVSNNKLDANNNFRFVNLNIIVGTAATEVSGLLLGFDCSEGDASAQNPASVVQVVG